ncbi:MAG: corrinoid protein [Bacillota bacterium]
MIDLNRIAESLTGGDDGQVAELTAQALAEGIDPGEIINKGLVAGMGEIGAKFKNGEIFLPEVLFAAKAMHEAMDILKPHIGGSSFKHAGKVVLGTVKGDLHDIGKNLVGMMLTGGGFEVVDLGIDVAPEKFVEAVKKHHPTHIGLSALLTTTLPNMKRTIEAINEAGLRQNVLIMVGGAPVNAEYAREIGADGYAPDAGSAVELARDLMAKRV